MRRQAQLTVLMVLTAAMVPIGGSPATAGNRYKTYVACGFNAQSEPSHACDRQGRKAAFFLSKDADVRYRVCVKFPGGTLLCETDQAGFEDELRVNRITSNLRGKHKVTWYVDDEVIGKWTFKNKNL